MKDQETLMIAEGVSKQYTLGMIGGKTLKAEIASWHARKRGKPDPNRKIGTEHIHYGEKFWALKNVSLDLHNSGFEGNIVTEYEKRFSDQGLPIYRLEAYKLCDRL